MHDKNSNCAVVNYHEGNRQSMPASSAIMVQVLIVFVIFITIVKPDPKATEVSSKSGKVV